MKFALLPSSPPTIIYAGRDRVSSVVLMDTPMGLSLVIDGQNQFIAGPMESITRHYHEVEAQVPMAVAPKIDRVAILGGGDGLALAEVLKFPVGVVHLVDYDKKVLKLARNNEYMREINKDSLHDSRVRIFVEDARDHIDKYRDFDVVILDFPAPGGKFSPLYTTKMFKKVRRAIAPWGVVMVQVTQEIFQYCDVAQNVARAFGRNFNMRFISDEVYNLTFNFILGSFFPIKVRRFPVGNQFINLEDIEGFVAENRYV